MYYQSGRLDQWQFQGGRAGLCAVRGVSKLSEEERKQKGRVRARRLTLARLIEGELKAYAPNTILLLAERAEAHLGGRHRTGGAQEML